MLDYLLHGLLVCLEPINLLAMLLSVPLGIIVGALPGFGAATGLVLVLPLTYTLEPGTAFVIMTGIYLGCEYGGCISAILINTPGTAAAIVTAFDGNPMAKHGKAREALLYSNTASFSGGILGGLAVLLLMPILGNFVLKFGAGEVFLLAAIGLFLVGSISKGDMFKGVVSAALGLFFTLFGTESVTGFSRFDFNIPILIGGLPIIAAMLAMFAVPQMIEVGLAAHRNQEQISFGSTGMKDNFHLFLRIFKEVYARQKMNLLRSSLFGVIIGIIPGVGASVASMAAYGSAKKASKEPEKFGTGTADGVVASESANNALVGGSLIPVVSLGIPGSPAAAIYMGAIFLHGMVPGPNFLIKQGDLVYTLIAAIFFCSIVQLIIGALSITSLANILKVSASRLFSVVLAICCIGTYVSRGLEFDIEFFIILGLASFFLVLMGFNMGALVLGAFLGNTMEVSLNEILAISPAMGGVVPYFMTRPIALGMLACILLYSLWLLYRFIRSARCREEEPDAPACQAPGSWRGMRGWDMAICLTLFLLSVFFWVEAQQYPITARRFPQLVLAVIILCSLFGMGKCLFFGNLYAGREVGPFHALDWKRVGILSGALIIYCVLIVTLGFYASTLVLALSTCWILEIWDKGHIPNRRESVRIVLFSILSTLAVYIIFTMLFGINMPAGILI